MEVYTKDGKVLQYNGKCIAPKATGEVWVLNEIVDTDMSFDIIIDPDYFISNGVIWYGISAIDHVLQYMDAEGERRRVYYSSSGVWDNQAYRTLEFAQPITDVLLQSWLEHNGTKQ